MAGLGFLVAVLASAIGSISGIGGGAIIKPVMDALGILPLAAVNFLSGCTVLTMAAVNYLRNIRTGQQIQYRISVFLAIGASLGGILGKQLFGSGGSSLGLVQAVLLLLLNTAVLAYGLSEHRIVRKKLRHRGGCLIVGLILGGVSTFLGIGGGPVNIAVLSYFYSMAPGEAARNSLFIILFSQLTGLVTAVVTAAVPDFPVMMLLLMAAGGVLGALIGSGIARRADDQRIRRWFLILLVFLIGLNIFNVLKYLHG